MFIVHAAVTGIMSWLSQAFSFHNRIYLALCTIVSTCASLNTIVFVYFLLGACILHVEAHTF